MTARLTRRRKCLPRSRSTPRLRAPGIHRGIARAQPWPRHGARRIHYVLASDDYYFPSKVGTQVAFIDANPEFGMAYMSGFCVDENRQSLNRVYRASITGKLYPHVAFFRPRANAPADAMVRKEILDNSS